MILEEFKNVVRKNKENLKNVWQKKRTKENSRKDQLKSKVQKKLLEQPEEVSGKD